MRTIAIIPARGGSKGILYKNIKLLAGKPLIHYVIETCIKTPGISGVYVSTDSREIKESVQEFKEVIVIDRPAELAADNTTSEDALLHAVKEISESGTIFDTILFPQATSPLSNPEDFSNLLEIIKEGHDSAAFYSEDYGFFFDESDVLSPRLPRQVREPRKREAGNAWAFKKDGFLESGSRLFGRVGLCKIEFPKNLEIDDDNDLQIVERLLLLKERKASKLYYKVRKIEGNDKFEENYWGAVVDPDGKERNRLEEKEQRIADIKEELSYINRQPSGRILDIGCGMGDLLSAVDNSWEKHGLEVSKYAAAEAAKHGAIYEGRLEDAPFSDEFFDLITMLHVVEHLDQPEETIIKVRDILKHNGTLIIATPDFDGALARRFGDNYRLLHDKTHISLFSRISLRHFLEDFGFEIEREEFPFFDTRYFTEENLLRLFDTSTISPPFWGNFMTFYCRKK